MPTPRHCGWTPTTPPAVFSSALSKGQSAMASDPSRHGFRFAVAAMPRNPRPGGRAPMTMGARSSPEAPGD